MQSRHWYVGLGMCASLVLACSDTKPAGSANADKTTGSESELDRAKDRVNSAHANFKEEIRPAAGWVDEKSHRVADEVVNAVKKGTKTLDGDGDQDHVSDTTGAAANGD
jgi:hypothetical protein